MICQFVLWSGATKKVSANLGYEDEDNDEPDVGEDGGGGGDDEDLAHSCTIFPCYLGN